MADSPVPLLKPPVWTWEVPTYFFVGGTAGAAAVIAALAGVGAAHASIAEHARWIAALGALAAPPLLVSDLGRPARFLNMLRVFKAQSPMSVGAWTLLVFSTAAVTSFLLHQVTSPPAVLTFLGAISGGVAALSGLVLATYTGVLIGVTAIPVWSSHVRTLPVIFGLSSLGAAVSLIELLGDRVGSLNAMGIGVAVVETWFLMKPERMGRRVRRPIEGGTPGRLVRSAGALSGPVALVFRLFSIWTPSVRILASSAMVAGSVMLRFGWIAAGRVSAHDRESSLR